MCGCAREREGEGDGERVRESSAVNREATGMAGLLCHSPATAAGLRAPAPSPRAQRAAAAAQLRRPACPPPAGTDVAPLVPALEKIWADSLGQSLADFNFR